MRRWILGAFLVVPIACDGFYIYTCGFDPGPDPLPHEPEIGYETNEGRYTATIISSEPWPPPAGEVSFELWFEAVADAGPVRLIADPAVRVDDTGERPTVPLSPIDDGAWQVGPIELDAGMWRIPLRLTDDRGSDAIELQLEIVDR